MSITQLNLKNFHYPDLFHAEGLARLDQLFLISLKKDRSDLYDGLLAYRGSENTHTTPEISDLLIHCANYLENFLANLFNIQEPLAISKIKTISLNPLSIFKKYFVLRRAKKETAKATSLPDFAVLNHWLNEALLKAPLQSEDKELAVALLGTSYLENTDHHAADIEKLVQWCAKALTTAEGKAIIANWTSFRIPERLDYMNLVETIPLEEDKLGRVSTPLENFRLRDGFALTDPRMNAREVQNEVNYCIYCHDHDGDFCSKGFPNKKGEKEKGFKKNPLDLIMTGCPLEEKISEMNFLKREGSTLAALAVVMIDNPMCPATGHRICNDCMKACIYQKQDPVNIPQIETRVLTDVLNLPWGVEIYDLLTRWNPLRQHQWVMKPYNGRKIMIAGMGPAGFTLAHHLLLEGFAVLGFDGLKIEPLPEKLIKKPIYQFKDLKESLDERLMAGFGGVAEYGITVRWDKNFLKLIYLSLMRRPYFQVFGGVRFGGTIKVEDAWRMGFDHLAVAVGAGLPKALPIPQSLATGMRQANDFLMALQLGNAAKTNSLTSLQIRMPAVVIGGGLTGVDTATELQAYYITQVEKILKRYQVLEKQYGKDNIHQQLDIASREILDEYLRHGLEVKKERERAKLANQRPNFIKLLRSWGGVTIAYRRNMRESPAYINNHEELQKALQEGIFYLEGVEPIAVDLNEHGHAEALICQKRLRNADNEWVNTTEEVRLPARSILAATGTQPNTAYEFEHRGTFNRLNLQYQHYEEDEEGKLSIAHGVLHCKDEAFGPFTSYQKEDKRVSLIGDTHPVFHGNVVKAIASGMRTYPKITAILQDKMEQGNPQEYQQFATEMQSLFQARIVSMIRKTATILEISIEAPLAAKHFEPGQFYRLQNFETFATTLNDTLFQMEPLALVATECDKEKGLLNFIVIEHNATTKLCAMLKPGELVSLMGPTGVRAKIPSKQETVLIIGKQSSFPFVRSYGKLMREAGNRVIYLGQFNDKEEVYCQALLENATDMIVWLTDSGETIKSTRSQDFSGKGSDMIAALEALGQNNLFGRSSSFALADVDRIFVVGNTALLRQFQTARQSKLKTYLLKDPLVFGSVYGNMQCMLKGVCAQCLQWQIDPETGKRTKAVFACSWQDQPLEIIDIDHIDARQWQNRLLDTLTHLWVDHLFTQHAIPRL